MAISDRLPGSLQENLLTLLCHSDEHGRAVADLVDPALFEGDYRMVAERAVDYWRRYGQAPGPHVADLLSDILEDPHDRRAPTFRGIIVEMLGLAEAVNARFAVDQLRSFVRMQRFQTLALETARRLTSRRELALPEVEELWADMLRAREVGLERGLSLNDTGRLTAYLQGQLDEFSTGIDLLDRRGVSPLREAVMLMLAPTGIGKTWFLIHVAKLALMARKRVLYVSLELSEEELGLRFYQSFFGATRRAASTGADTLFTRVLEKDSLGRLTAIEREAVEPEFSLDSDAVEDELEVRRRLMEGKFKNIEVRRFPTRGLTVNGLRAYLDSLAQVGFEPDLVVLDYIGIMKTDARDHRISLGRAFEDFRGLCVERHVAGVTAQQISREGGRSGRSSQYTVAEDFSLVGTSDFCLSLSATSAEKRLGLARLFVDKARSERDRFGVLLAQNYPTGQFAVDSAPLDKARYEDLLPKEEEGDDGDEEYGE